MSCWRPGSSWSVFASEACGERLICPNYGLFDRRGNYFVTDSGQWRKRNGRLLRFTQDGRGETIGAAFGYANGLALSANERHLFMVESDADRVFRVRDDPVGWRGRAGAA